jgi:copper chaperone CopZ
MREASPEGETMSELSLAIEGMSCGHCVAQVERALRQMPGVRVRDVRVGEARVELGPGAPEVERVVAGLAEVGYTARVAERNSP